MYAAQYDTVRYTFEASGSLWKDALVMRDRQTGSLWSQVYGVAIDGARTDDTLTLFPSEFITFGALKNKYPEAKILKKEGAGPPGSHYRRYFEDPKKIGIFGHTFESEELPAKSLVLGLREGRRVVAVPLEELSEPTLTRVELGERIAVVYYNPTNLEAFAFSISATEAKSGALRLAGQGQISFAGQELNPAHLRGNPKFTSLPVVTAYWFAWKSFFPNAEIVRPQGAK